MNQTTTLPTHPLSNYEPFRAWLLSLPPETLVGKASTPLDCPLRHFVKTTLNADCLPSVGARYYGWYDSHQGTEVNFPLERWGRLFVYYLDSKYGDQWVTAWQALDMLDAAISQAEESDRSWVELLHEQAVNATTIAVKELVTA